MNILMPNYLFGKYKLIELKGEGATAQVWSAVDPQGKNVALKIFAPQTQLDSFSRDLIKDEFDRTKNLIHKNLVVPFDHIIHKGRPALVMHLCEKSMWQLLVQKINNQKSGLDPKGEFHFSEFYLVKLINQIVSALDFLHNKAFLHNDVKPANILVNNIDDEHNVQFYLSDFGITKEIRDTILRQTKVRNSLTFAYASPEKLQGKNGSFRSDIFSLGASVYELINGLELDMPLGQILNNNGEIPPINKHYTKGFKNLIFGMLKMEPFERLSSKEILDHTEVYLQNRYWPGEVMPSSEHERSTLTYSNRTTIIASDKGSIINNPFLRGDDHRSKSVKIKPIIIAGLAAVLLTITGWFAFTSSSDKDAGMAIIKSYDQATKVNDDLYIVQRGVKWGVIRSDGEIFKDIKYKRIDRKTSRILVLIDDNNIKEEVNY